MDIADLGEYVVLIFSFSLANYLAVKAAIKRGMKEFFEEEGIVLAEEGLYPFIGEERDKKEEVTRI